MKASLRFKCGGMERLSVNIYLHHTIRFHTIRFETITIHTIKFHTIRFNTIRFHTIRFHTHLFHRHDPASVYMELAHLLSRSMIASWSLDASRKETTRVV